MNQKLSRNDLCTCGSGKKYKKCCLRGESTNSSNIIDLAWIKLRQTEREVIDNYLLPYMHKELPQDLLLTALEEFYLHELPDEIDVELIFDGVFVPWSLFYWKTKDYEYKKLLNNQTVAQHYLQKYEKQLNSSVKNFIKAMDKSYYSFYIIEEVEYEKHLIVRDILLDTTHIIKEKLGTHTLKKGHILFASILMSDNQSIFIGCSPYLVPVKCYLDLLDYKEQLTKANHIQELNGEILQFYSQNELLYYYFEKLTEAYNPQMPRLFNTDGDPIVFLKLYFKNHLPIIEVLKKLLPLTLSKDSEEFLDDAEFNSAGEIVSLDIQWFKKGNKKHKDWDNTVMGYITIKQKKITLEVNSEKRAEKGKKLFEKYLGNKVEFQKMQIETAEQKLQSKKQFKDEDHLDVELSPEMEEHLKEMARAHWESWFEEKIPALNNMTPREAAKTKEGVAKLKMLLLQYEAYDANSEDQLDIFKAAIDCLKKELNIK